MFEEKPVCIWIIGQDGLYLTNPINQAPKLDYSRYTSSSTILYSILLDNVPDTFNSFIVGGTAIVDRFVSKCTGLGTYSTRYSTSSEYVKETGYGWALSLGKWSDNTYSWYCDDF